MAKKKRKKRKNSRDKGNRGQRAVAKLLAPWWGADFASTPMSGGFATKKFRDEWNAAADVVTPDVTFPFSVEVKWQEDWHMEQLIKSDKCEPWKWWDQCVRECPVDKIPLLVFRRNHQPWYYMMWEMDTKADGVQFSLLPPGQRDTEAVPGCNAVVVGLFSDILKTDKERWIEWNDRRNQLQLPGKMGILR